MCHRQQLRHAKRLRFSVTFAAAAATAAAAAVAATAIAPVAGWVAALTVDASPINIPLLFGVSR